MTKPILFLSLIFAPLLIFGQTIQKQLMLTDRADSLYLKSASINFDPSGNYCIVVKKNGQSYFYTNSDTIGPFKSIHTIGGGSGGYTFTYEDTDDKNEAWYYKSDIGVKVYGPLKGRIKNAINSDTKTNIALTVAYKNFIYYYLNGKLVSKAHQLKKTNYDLEDWCSFSENGHAIYYTRQKGLFSIFCNGIKLATSPLRYYGLSINNQGQYTYGEVIRKKSQENKRDYAAFAHSIDTTLGPVRALWYQHINDAGGYYYSGDDNGPDYLIVNNTLHKNLDTIKNITLMGKSSYLYTFMEKGIKKVNANGNTFIADFTEIYFPSIDTIGNFAFFGRKGDLIYKYINGEQSPNPIAKFGVKNFPLYISPSGQALYYLYAGDSTYLYLDDQIIVQTMRRMSSFKVMPYHQIIPDYYVAVNPNNGNNLFYIEIDSIGYFVFNGIFSKPMQPATENHFELNQKTGEIITGKFDDKGFYILQKTGEEKFFININNKTYQEIEGLDRILKHNCFFDGKKLVFYGIKGLAFYQYILTI